MEVAIGTCRPVYQLFLKSIPSMEEETSFFWQKLYKTGREMQERIMDLLVVVENEDVTVELIQVNEDLNNAILGYERWADGVAHPFTSFWL